MDPIRSSVKIPSQICMICKHGRISPVKMPDETIRDMFICTKKARTILEWLTIRETDGCDQHDPKGVGCGPVNC